MVRSKFEFQNCHVRDALTDKDNIVVGGKKDRKGKKKVKILLWGKKYFSGRGCMEEIIELYYIYPLGLLINLRDLTSNLKRMNINKILQI